MSLHFTLAELTASNKAAQLGIDNTPDEEASANLENLASMLEDIRASLGNPVTVTSGYRSPALNKAVGGVPSSDHVKGCAADIICPAFGTPKEVARHLAAKVDELGIGQVIYEALGGRAWTHVSIRPTSNPVNRIISITEYGTTAGIVA